MTVLVTGAAGFIGSHLVDRLLARGDAVVGLDCFDAFYDPAIKRANLARAQDYGRFRLVEADIRDAAALRRLPQAIDRVVHLAARAGVRPSLDAPALYADVNVRGTATLLEEVRRRELGSFVFASSSSVYGNSDRVPFREDDPVARPISPYAATKRAAELLCHVASHVDGVTCLCLRLFTVYGPRQRPDLAIHKFTDRMTRGQAIPIFGDGTTARDYTYVDDLVDGLVRGLDWAGHNQGAFETVNLGESRTITLDHLVSVLASALGIEPRIDRQPMQPGDVERTHADITKARSLLGYDPGTDFEAGIERFVDWYRSCTMGETDRSGDRITTETGESAHA